MRLDKRTFWALVAAMVAVSATVTLVGVALLEGSIEDSIETNVGAAGVAQCERGNTGSLRASLRNVAIRRLAAATAAQSHDVAALNGARPQVTRILRRFERVVEDEVLPAIIESPQAGCEALLESEDTARAVIERERKERERLQRQLDALTDPSG